MPGLKVVKSAVAILEQEGKETISIGDAAIQNAPLAKDFQIAFKKRPSEMNKIERGRMVAFMKGVYAEILNNHPDYKTRHHVVYIARPSQDELWKSEEEAYLKNSRRCWIACCWNTERIKSCIFSCKNTA